MNFTSIALWCKNAKATIDGIIAIGSLILVPVITVTPIVWLSEGHVRLKSNLRTHQVDGQQQLSGDLRFDKTPLKVKYVLELVDPNSGDVVTFPAVETKGVPRFDNTLLPVPKSIRPGHYQLRARVHYVVNPLTTQDEVVEVSTLAVN